MVSDGLKCCQHADVEILSRQASLVKEFNGPRSGPGFHRIAPRRMEIGDCWKPAPRGQAIR